MGRPKKEKSGGVGGVASVEVDTPEVTPDVTPDVTPETAPALLAAESAEPTASEPIASDADGNLVIDVLPENIVIDPDIHELRTWYADIADATRNPAARHMISIPQLARMIQDEGQKNPGLVWDGPEGMTLISGERRKCAIELLRAEGLDIMFRVIIDPTITNADQAFRSAMMLNVHTEKFSHSDMAKRVIPSIRRRFKLGGGGGTATEEVAEFLGIDKATVTQYERFAKLPEDTRKLVDEDRMSLSSALDVAMSPADKQPEVTERAQQLADADAEQKRLKAEQKQREREREREEKKREAEDKKAARKQKPSADAQTDTQTNVQTEEEKLVVQGRVVAGDTHDYADNVDTDLQGPEPDPESEAANLPDAEPAAKSVASPAPSLAPIPARIEQRHVRQAQEEVPGAITRPRAPKMIEMLTFFEGASVDPGPGPFKSFFAEICNWGHGTVHKTVAQRALADLRAHVIERKKGKVVKGPVKTSAKPAKKSAGKTAGKPVVKPASKSAPKAVGKPAGKQAGKPSGKPSGKPPIKKSVKKSAPKRKAQ